MTKSTIRSNLTVFNSDIAATKENGLEYVLGETNSYACHVSVSSFASGFACLTNHENPVGRTWG